MRWQRESDERQLAAGSKQWGLNGGKDHYCVCAGLSMDAESDIREAVQISADVQPLHDWGSGEIWGVAGDAERVVADFEM